MQILAQNKRVEREKFTQKILDQDLGWDLNKTVIAQAAPIESAALKHLTLN